MNWREWLADDRLLGIDQVESTAGLLLLALAGSLVSSLLVAILYVKFYGRRGTGSQVHRAFLLIGPAITAIFIAVQFSLPLSLGLLGALSIVRFRMPIKEAEEIGFILLIVAVSVSWATLNLQLLGIVLLISIVGLLLASYWPLLRGRSGDGMFVISLPRSEYARKSGELMAALDGGLRGGRLESISESEEQATLSYTFSRLDGTELVSLRQALGKISEGLSSQVFFNQSDSP